MSVSRENILHDISSTYLFHSWDEIRRYTCTHDYVLKLDIFPSLRIALHGFDVPNDFRVLPRSTRLLLVRVIEIGLLRDRLPECDAWLASGAVYIVLAAHPLDVDLEVQFTHTRNDCLRKG